MHKKLHSVDIFKLPVLPLRGLTVFPFMTLPFDVMRPKSIRALEEAMEKDQLVMLVSQIDPTVDHPLTEESYRVGTISKVKQFLRLPGENIRVLVEGLYRGKILDYTSTEPYFEANVEQFDVEEVDDEEEAVTPLSVEAEALKRQLLSFFGEYAEITGRVQPEAFTSMASIADNASLADTIASHMPLKTEQKQEILEEFDGNLRLEKLLKILVAEIQIAQIEKGIHDKVRSQIDKMQKDYYLREQMKVIQSELGEKEGVAGEVDELRKKMLTAGLSKEAADKVEKELDRLLKMPPGSAETGVIRTYVEWVLDLPWNKTSEEKLDLTAAQKILDEDHYGLDKVKERIIEFLAIKVMQKSLKGPILCLVGPPGVGKTSIAKSIARAINRHYVRMSLGGVKDESEIRGHRKTYVGAMPGRIIAAVKQAGTKNPLILLDEIDKMSSDYRGDPASAMLEVLDSEQNFSFRDHYLELAFDLSDVMFLTTANSTDTIPRALLDRMEVIQISSYTEEEKLQIAMNHLVQKQRLAHGMKKSQISFQEDAVRDIINYYTREAGVRSLERQLANICRKAARLIVSGEKKSITVNAKAVATFLGARKFAYDRANAQDQIGIATGLAWTAVGGDTLSIEVNVMKGKGKVELTGQLGDVMQESAKAAISFVRSRVEALGIDPAFAETTDIHVHVPEGATPKDGPSAGITLATAIISALSNKPVRNDVAMTGEITLRGRVLPIGGLKEKVIAAHRAGIKTVIIPAENQKDLEEIPANIRDKMTFVIASTMDQVLATALR
ncbi:MAG: endopeptidase La [Clostridia bacterium]